MSIIKYFTIALAFAFATDVSAREDVLSLVECGKEFIVLDGMESGKIPPSEKGTTHMLKVPAGTTKVKLKEEKRKTRISEDFATLKKIADSLVGTKVLKELEVVAVTKKECVIYEQHHNRTTVEVQALDAQDKEIGSFTLVAGPTERFYLSADMPVTNIKQLSYDSGTNSVIEKEKPASFYIGLNAKMGDVFRNYSSDEFYNDISIKVLIKASSRPSESMGVGIGYSFKLMEVFVARVWTKDDQNAGGASIGTTASTIFGVSFNPTKGLEWIKQ